MRSAAVALGMGISVCPPLSLWYAEFMDTIIRDVRDIELENRNALEHVLGHKLNENQRVIIQVVSPTKEVAVENGTDGTRLPDWCDVFAGLSDEEIAEIESVIRQRSDLTRVAD